MERKEHKIGERFKDGNTLLETVKCEFCEGCFYCNNGCSNSKIHGHAAKVIEQMTNV